jgi:hypothetical protein
MGLCSGTAALAVPPPAPPPPSQGFLDKNGVPTGLSPWNGLWRTEFYTSNTPLNRFSFGGQCLNQVALGHSVPFVLFSAFVGNSFYTPGAAAIFDYQRQQFVSGSILSIPPSAFQNDGRPGPFPFQYDSTHPLDMWGTFRPTYPDWQQAIGQFPGPDIFPGSEQDARESFEWWPDQYRDWNAYAFAPNQVPQHAGHYGLFFSSGGVRWLMPIAKANILGGDLYRAGAHEKPWPGGSNFEWTYAATTQWTSGLVSRIHLCDFDVVPPSVKPAKMLSLAKGTAQNVLHWARARFGNGLRRGLYMKLVGELVEGLHLAHPRINLAPAIKRFGALKLKALALGAAGSRTTFDRSLQLHEPGSSLGGGVPLALTVAQPPQSPTLTANCHNGFASVSVDGTMAPSTSHDSLTVTYSNVANPQQRYVRTVAMGPSGYNDRMIELPDFATTNWQVTVHWAGDATRSSTTATCLATSFPGT